MQSDERVLILTSTQKDSDSTQKLLNHAGLQTCVCKTINELVQNLEEGAGAVLLAKEVLIGPNLQSFIEHLDTQPSWSDLPIVVLAGTGDLTQASQQAIRVLKLIRNTTVLERPVRVATLISVVESAIANRRRQYEVRNLLKELLQARQEAERANKTKSEFLANMSHEIRTPLGILLSFTEFANDDSLEADERKKYFSAIERNGRLLLELVNDILDLAKVESGKIAIERVETSLADLLTDTITGLSAKAKPKGVNLNLSLPEKFPENFITDPVRFQQILTNVIGNAIKFTEKGSVNTAVSWSMVDAGIAEISVKVTDTGLGMTPSQAKKLFQPFTQADSSMTRKFGGTGLGLVLSRQLAQALGGNLQLIETNPGVGSTFEILIRAEVINKKPSEAHSPTPVLPTYAIEGMNVLVVDDSVDNLFIISRILKQAGLTVETAENGKEAIEKAISRKYDAILMDIQMPEMDGAAATKYLREKGYQRPIIALTANALKGDREKAMDSGFDDYITKPVQRHELYASLGHFERVAD